MKLRLLKAILPSVLVLTFVSCSSEPEALNETTPTKELVAQHYSYNEAELELVDLINAHRQNLGLNALQTMSHISFTSEEHNAYMIAKNAVNHDFFDERSQNIVDALGATKVSENVAYNFSTAESVLHAWLSSASHRENIEGDFTHFGLCISINPTNGNRYYTNIFIKK